MYINKCLPAAILILLITGPAFCQERNTAATATAKPQQAQEDEAKAKAAAKAEAAKLAERKNEKEKEAAILKLKAQAQAINVRELAMPIGGAVRAQAAKVDELRNSARFYSLYNLAEAKLDTRGKRPKAIFMVDSYRFEQQTRTVNVTRTVNEEKKVLEVVDGEEVIVKMNFPVRKQEQQERTYNTRVPAGRKPKAVDLDRVEFYRLDGSLVELGDLKKILSSLHPVFIYHMEPDRVTIQPAHEMIRKVMAPDTLLAVTAELRPKPAPPVIVKPPVPAK
ncbi:MAG: hypothetical protein AAF483_01080 [Planctomycetota bacterium]